MHKSVKIRLTKGIRGVGKKGKILNAFITGYLGYRIEIEGYYRYLNTYQCERVFEKCIKL